MRTVGIIAEYNPFHNGHFYHIQKAKELTGADYVIAVMSGDFVQRGAPAVFDKSTRARMALSSGADLVLELPVYFAASSAEDFAACGIALLDRIGVTDAVCFGSECGDLGPLFAVANLLKEETAAYKAALKKQLSQGLTYPDARNQALLSCLSEEEAAVLSSPNNILGIEYLKALLRRDSRMQPATVKRCGHDYHDQAFSDAFVSATAIRNHLYRNGELKTLQSQMPRPAYDLIREARPVFPDDLSFLLNYSLLTLEAEKRPFSEYLDVSEELEARLKRSLLQYGSFSQRIADLKTKQYTYSRISRCLLHLMLGIKKDEVSWWRDKGYCGYARVLGFKKESAEIMTGIKSHGSIPLITKIADARKQLGDREWAMLEKDLYASHVYQTVLHANYGIVTQNEYNRPLVIV